MIFSYPGYVQMQPMAATDPRSKSFYTVVVDARAKTLTLSKGKMSKDPKWRAASPTPSRRRTGWCSTACSTGIRSTP